MYLVTEIHFSHNLFGQGDPVPPPHLQFFLLGFRQFPWPGRTGVGGTCPHATLWLRYWPGLTSIQHAALHKTGVQNNQWYILTGKQSPQALPKLRPKVLSKCDYYYYYYYYWYQLPEFIPSNLNSGLHSCISISIHSQHVIETAKSIN